MNGKTTITTSDVSFAITTPSSETPLLNVTHYG